MCPHFYKYSLTAEIPTKGKDMALWGNNDNVTSTGTVSLNYDTGVVTGSGTTFVTDLTEGQVIRFGMRDNVYFGDAVITGITSALFLPLVIPLV